MIKNFLDFPIKKKILVIAIAIIILYFLICLIIVGIRFLCMVNQNKDCRRIDEGNARFDAIEKVIGKAEYNIYTDEEIAKNQDLKDIKLYYFPADETNIQTTNFSLLVPGGGYYSSDPALVSFGYAIELNKKGINCFVLNYRVKKQANNEAPLEDLTRALKLIIDNKDTFKVNEENYNLTGFSAGGHLVSLFCTRYKELGFKKPTTVNLIYPWVSLGKGNKITGNVVYDIFSATERKIGLDYFIGKKRTKKDINDISVMDHIDNDFPPCYILQGKSDVVLNYKYNSEELIKVLDKNNIEYKYDLIDGLNHGFGVGKGTKAEGWEDTAYAFWNSKIN